ncbi:MAG: META domain-containing protein [Chloroflexota bacterium]|nr:META domain-containing protein [Chloroflexota bacterium]
MRRFSLIMTLFALCALLALPAAAQDVPNMVSFNGFSFSYESQIGTQLTITSLPAEDTLVEYPGGPQPVQTRYAVSTAAPADGMSDGQPPALTITVFNRADLAAYPASQSQADALMSLLAGRPDLAPMMRLNVPDDIGGVSLPLLPISPGVQEIRARAEYVDFGNFSGVAYITSIGFDVSPILASELRFIFQGISSDGATYVSLVAPLTTALVSDVIPADFDDALFGANMVTEFNSVIETLNAASPSDFSPSLDALTRVVRSINMSAIMPGLTPPQVSSPPPTAEPAPDVIVNNDPSLGGLVGAWTLVDFGAAEPLMLPIDGVPITIEFSGESGLAGTDGCNNYSGAFIYEESTLIFAPLVSTLMACPPSIMELADAYRAALQTVTAYAVMENMLTLTYESGMLRFTKVAP